MKITKRDETYTVMKAVEKTITVREPQEETRPVFTLEFSEEQIKALYALSNAPNILLDGIDDTSNASVFYYKDTLQNLLADIFTQLYHDHGFHTRMSGKVSINGK